MQTEWWQRVRKDDPVTSKIAAQTIDEVAPAHEVRIIYALQHYGPLTGHEIADCVGLTYQQVSKRLPELERGGHVMPTGETSKSPANRPSRVWRINESR